MSDKTSEFYDSRGNAAILGLGLQGIPVEFSSPFEFAYGRLERHFTPGMNALDFACGEGLQAVRLSQIGYKVTGLDISPVSIAAAKKLATEKGQNISFIVGSFDDIDPQQKFDVIFISGALYYFFNDETIAWLKSRLKPNGKFVSIEPLKDNFLLKIYRHLKKQIRKNSDSQSTQKLLEVDHFLILRNEFSNAEIQFFDFITIALRILRKLPRLQKALLPITQFVDRSLLTLWPTMAFRVVFIGTDLKENAKL